jgi:hypothetical protein
MYGFVRSRQLDGTLAEGPKFGSYIITNNRVLASWGMVSEKRWPYPKGRVAWPPVEPEGLDEVAKFNRTFAHFRIRDLADARTCIARTPSPVSIAVPIYPEWYESTTGIIEVPAQDLRDAPNHCIILVDYNDGTQMFTFINSWGTGWGDRGYGYLPYQYFTTFLREAWTSIFPSGSQLTQEIRRVNKPYATCSGLLECPW